MTDLPDPELYDRYFTVQPAATPELLNAAYALRYQVYCVEHAFENAAEHPNHLETDQYDDHAVHAVLIHRPSGDVVGCVRLILPQPGSGIGALPMRHLLSGEAAAQLDACDPTRTAEISRYAVSKSLRRRQGEELYPDVNEISTDDMRRIVPHVSVGLVRAVAQLAADRGVTKVCAAMAPALGRLLERFGLVFERLGPTIEYHGSRQPCVADCEDLIAGMASRHSAHHRIVDEAYRRGHHQQSLPARSR